MLHFLYAWFATRPWYRLLLGLPAILLAGLVLLGFLSKPFYTDQAIGRRYRVALVNAAQQDDANTMFLAYRKLLQLNAADNELVFQMSQLMAQAGQWEQAIAGMQRIAPLDRPGLAAAHLWLIQAIQAGRLGLAREDAIQQIDQHFQQLTKLAADDPNVPVQHAIFLAQVGQFDRALKLLEPLIEKQPTVRMVVAAVMATQDGPEAGKQYLRETIEQFEPRTLTTDKDKKLSPAEFATLIEAHRMLDQWDAAESVLQQATAQHPQDESLQRLKSAFLVQLAKRKRGETLDTGIASLDLLSQAVDADIMNASSWLGMIELSRAEGELGQQAAARLDELAARADAPSVARLLLGTEKAAKGKYDDALAQLQRVVEESPNDAVAWNNLAWVLNAIGDDLTRAKQCADRAIQLAPNDLRFLETRGKIYAKLQMWDEAIADLEKVLPAFKDEPSVKQTLEMARAMVQQREASDE